MLVYSVGSRESLQSTSKWLSTVRAALPSNSNPITVMVGNKSDLRDGTIDSRSEVPGYEAQSYAQNLGIRLFEASAANNAGVEDPFRYIAEEFARKYEQEAAYK